MKKHKRCSVGKQTLEYLNTNAAVLVLKRCSVNMKPKEHYSIRNAHYIYAHTSYFISLLYLCAKWTNIK